MAATHVVCMVKNGRLKALRKQPRTMYSREKLTLGTYDSAEEMFLDAMKFDAIDEAMDAIEEYKRKHASDRSDGLEIKIIEYSIKMR